jgi:hypothetical protein
MGNIGSYVNITSACHGHQAENETTASLSIISSEPRPGRLFAPFSLPGNGAVMVDLSTSDVSGVTKTAPDCWTEGLLSTGIGSRLDDTLMGGIAS